MAAARLNSELDPWLHQRPSARLRGPRNNPPRPAELRFAFYGRVSTEDRQEPAASRQWQREVATQTIATAGTVVADYFDIGCSRSIPWHNRPQAAALLDALADPNRGFDAIIVGESDRAFSGTQLQQILPILHRHGVAVWLPELDGPLDPHNPVHQVLVLMLGHDARQEVLRARHRTLTAMRVLARDEGRYLGGRAPYGYRLVDAGRHPNPLHARWGRRLRRLHPDPATARHVRWIFKQRLAGHSRPAIAAMLTARGIPCPSATDPARNPHRTGIEWSPRAVDTILANPRYTGRQVWDRQSIVHHETSPGARHTGKPPTRRTNTRDQWVVSGARAHPALISDATFVAAQRVSAIATPEDGQEHCYLLVGLVFCGLCGRRAEPQWASGRAAYRCRHGRRGKRAVDSPLPFYAREDALLAAAAVELDAWTGEGQQLGDPDAVADYLRAQDLALRCTRDAVVVEGELPDQLTIPGLFSVDPADCIGTFEDRVPQRSRPLQRSTSEVCLEQEEIPPQNDGIDSC
ncbi:recombinase family protein [Actinoplanes oblitus]|uniref:Recombinase family protein n=1 Tax=Actinoplanes oblitus TaxID=3040509 RepID=A0ABY8WME2_9ACTN|nr:recombinase family protein [Actinoplanes oblitus]WIM98647.1 recombinase family protein [Actinoplanes oblitus]